ncbi:unnamed protein product [Caenorhabditis auriculariae]|uniref:Uncharacterized protein n=1 Tax=Caenorhabditis auriculariae TaxID=2777116 RepID=A0A8S1HLK4_9PELO|nr:unnamed protein product [Caenorhabditis auriculariae]
MADGSPERGAKRNEDVLASKQLNVQYKRYYVDVKENQRGRFIKNRRDRQRPQVAAGFLDERRGQSPRHLDSDGSNTENKVLKSESLVFDTRRYFLDLKQNDRGRFLRISQLIVVTPRSTRQQIAIPEEGIVEIRDTFAEFIDKFSAGYLDEASSSNKNKVVAGENKQFIFEPNENDRGQFVRITEVKNSGYRTSITVPASALENFRTSIDEVIADLNRKNAEK